MGTEINKLVFLKLIFPIHSNAEKLNLRQCSKEKYHYTPPSRAGSSANTYAWLSWLNPAAGN